MLGVAKGTSAALPGGGFAPAGAFVMAPYGDGTQRRPGCGHLDEPLQRPGRRQRFAAPRGLRRHGRCLDPLPQRHGPRLGHRGGRRRRIVGDPGAVADPGRGRRAHPGRRLRPGQRRDGGRRAGGADHRAAHAPRASGAEDIYPPNAALIFSDPASGIVDPNAGFGAGEPVRVDFSCGDGHGPQRRPGLRRGLLLRAGSVHAEQRLGAPLSLPSGGMLPTGDSGTP